jgi:hypothetical protein
VVNRPGHILAVYGIRDDGVSYARVNAGQHLEKILPAAFEKHSIGNQNGTAGCVHQEIG